MKNKQNLVAATLIGLTVIFSVTAFTSEQVKNEIVTVRVIEVNRMTGWGSSEIIMVKNGEQKIIELESNAYKVGNSEKNMVTITQTLNELSSEGYQIDAASAKGDNGVLITDYIMSK